MNSVYNSVKTGNQHEKYSNTIFKTPYIHAPPISHTHEY